MSLKEQVADLIDSCQLRQGELFEEKYSKEERASREFFDVTDITKQAELEYADEILRLVAEWGNEWCREHEESLFGHEVYKRHECPDCWEQLRKE